MKTRTATNILLSLVACLLAFSLLIDWQVKTNPSSQDADQSVKLVQYEKCLDLVKGVSKGIGGEYNYAERFQYQMEICQRFKP